MRDQIPQDELTEKLCDLLGLDNLARIQGVTIRRGAVLVERTAYVNGRPFQVDGSLARETIAIAVMDVPSFVPRESDAPTIDD